MRPEESNHQTLILVDEVLTPDSSRYWPLADFSPGHPQPSFDKQFVRDALVRAGFKQGRESEKWTVDPEVVQGTNERYVRALEMLTGEEIE
jgi:phosphoribosylaminoimidazole-succinocarboxamide synthase